MLANGRNVLGERTDLDANAIEGFCITILAEMADLRDNFFMFGLDMGENGIGCRDGSGQAILGFQVIGTVHKQQGVGGSFGQNLGGEQFNAGGKFSGSKGHLSGIGVADGVGEVDDQDGGAIGCGPIELAFLGLGTDAAPEDGVINTKALEDLWQLGDVSEAIGDIAHAHGIAKVGGLLQADL